MSKSCITNVLIFYFRFGKLIFKFKTLDNISFEDLLMNNSPLLSSVFHSQFSRYNNNFSNNFNGGRGGFRGGYRGRGGFRGGFHNQQNGEKNYFVHNNPPTNWTPTAEFFAPEMVKKNFLFFFKTWCFFFLLKT